MLSAIQFNKNETKQVHKSWTRPTVESRVVQFIGLAVRPYVAPL